MQGIFGKIGGVQGGGGVYYVYMLRCRGGVYYTGLTVDVERRFAQHLAGKGAKFTRAYPPEAIAAVWRCGDKGTAARVEYAIKKRLTHGQKQTLAAAPEMLAALLPEIGAWKVTAEG